VTEHLLTPCGLRTLSPKDPQYHGFYGGSQLKRDMAYHQGTVWVFPMGAYYRAYLRMYGRQGIPAVRQRLENISNMLQEGCAGQLPEIYDGDYPQKGKGCHAQAWSVGEMLRVYEMLEQMENP
jgi:glycogen debranching enzyme